MFWVVQENIRDEDRYIAFVQALRDLNVEHTIVKVVPFSHEVIPDVNPTGRVVAWGSVSMDDVSNIKGWKPGVFNNENFNMRVWTKIYGSDMLNYDVEFHEFCKVPKFEGVRFIRPVADNKVFSGMVVHGEELSNWQEQIWKYSDGYIRIRPETMIGVSSTKEIALEWRFFIVGGKIVTGSRYRQWGLTDVRESTPETDPGAWEFVQQRIDQWQPSEAFVLDVSFQTEAQVTGSYQPYKVIEINCINSAGFYHCDMRALVEAIERL